MSDDKTRIAGRHSVVEIGTELNQTYRIDEPIGVGGMGEVFKGHNIQTGDPVAIKIVLPELARDDMIIGLFRKEARILNHLSHDAIVRYYVFSIDPAIERPYLAMEFVDGPSLAARVKTTPLATGDFMPLLRRLADGLHRAHEVGVIHRDMSPDNVILPGGSVKDAKIIDFGIARSANVGGGTLLGGSFAGKYSYVSPEQLGLFGGEVTPKSDIYSLALVMAAAIRGTPVDMGGSQAEVIEKRRKVPDLAGIPRQFHAVLSAMLQPDPAKRPASMAAIRDWPDEPGAARGKPPKPASGDHPRRETKPGTGAAAGGASSHAMRYIGITVAVLAVAATGVLGGWIFVRENAVKPQEGSVAARSQAVASQQSGTAARPPTTATTPQTTTAEPPSSAATANPPPNATTASASQPEAAPPPASTEQPTPQTPPQQQTASVETPTATTGSTTSDLRDFVASYGAGKCFASTQVALGDRSARIEALGTASAGQELATAFTAKAGFAPQLALDEVTDSQCALVSAMHSLSVEGAAPITLTIAKPDIRGNNADSGAAGDPLSISIAGVGQRNLYLFVMDHNGGIQNINRLCAACIVTRPEQTTAALTLYTPAKVQGETPPPFYPMLVFAVASAKPLISINSQDAFDASDFIPPFIKEISATGAVTTAVAYVKLRPQ